MANATCSIEGCETHGRLTRGWCNKHYLRYLRHGDPSEMMIPYGLSLEEHLLRHMDVGHPLGCWEWTGNRNQYGYGTQGATIDGRRRLVTAHRAVFTMMRGEVPDGLDLDHLCRVRHCVNPDHLEPVDRSVNTLRGYGAAALNARKKRCKRGHEFTEENTRVNRQGKRICRACARLRHAKARMASV